MRSALNSSVYRVLTTEGEKLFQCEIARGKREFFGASLMSGVYNIERYMMTW